MKGNVLSAPIFLKCRSTPAIYQKKEWHSHIAPFEKIKSTVLVPLSKLGTNTTNSVPVMKTGIPCAHILTGKNLFSLQGSCYPCMFTSCPMF